jgi:hypothetical protein
VDGAVGIVQDAGKGAMAPPALIRCPRCRRLQPPSRECVGCGVVLEPPPLPASGTEGTAAGSRSDAASPFDHDRFLVGQQILALNFRYLVHDERGRLLMFVERPIRLRNVGAIMVALAAGGLVLLAGLAMALLARSWLLALLSLPAAAATAFFVTPALSVRRHVQVYRDESKKELLLDVHQDQLLVFFAETFTVRDPRQGPIALFRRNRVMDAFRRTWQVYGSDGHLMCVARGESYVQRRLLDAFVAPQFTTLRLYRGDSDLLFGELQRRLSLEERWVLDLSKDPRRVFDRRVAVALALMADIRR